MRFVAEIESHVSAWPGVSVHPHRFGGRDFQFRDAEVGHVHTGGIVDIPFPRSLRDALLDEGLAEEHTGSRILAGLPTAYATKTACGTHSG